MRNVYYGPYNATSAPARVNYEKLSKKELLSLWYDTAKEISKTNPTKNYKKWVVLQRRYDAIVKAYYYDWDGVVQLEQEN